MAKKQRKFDGNLGYPSSCIDASRWGRTVQSVPNHLGYSATAFDAQGNMIKQIDMRRQESCKTTFTRDIQARKDGVFSMDKMREDKAISEDFFRNSMDYLDKRFNISNENICEDYVKSHNPNNNRSKRWQAICERDYYESLEQFNICRNCLSPIKARKVSLNGRRIFAVDNRGVCKITVENGAVSYVADIPEHWEVYVHPRKNTLKFRKVAKKTTFNQKCECMFVEVRKQERQAEMHKRKPRMM